MKYIQRLVVALATLHVMHAMPAMNFDPATGTFSFSYDTGTGGYHQQQGSAGGGVSGKYGFSGEGGSNVAVSYSAGGGGGGAPMGAPAGQGGTLNLNLNPDGVYSYDYQLSDQSKSESRGADGKVKGMFSFTGKDGKHRAVTYTADERGFLPEGDHLPKPVEPMMGMGDMGSYSAGPMGGSGTMNLNMQPGGVYSYDYSLPDQSKSESRGADGKVKGQFSYKDKEGQKSISYTADERGFLPEGAHLPKAPEPGAPAAPAAHADPYSAGDSGFGGGSVSGQYSINNAGGSQKSSYNAGPQGFVPIHSISINL